MNSFLSPRTRTLQATYAVETVTQSQCVTRLGPRTLTLARRYGPEALLLHVKLMRASKNEDVRQRSANVILDRAYGRPSQGNSGEEDNPLELLMQHLDGKTRGLPSEQQ